MPFAFVIVDRESPSFSTDAQVRAFGLNTQQTIADVLTTDDAPLASSEVEIELIDRHPWRHI